MGGLLLKLKGHSESSLSNLRAHTEIGRPYVRVEPIDDDGNVVVLEGHDVRCETPDGQVLEERPEIRRLFPKKSRRWLHWDRLDALYFVAYTQWTYNALPALLSRDDIEWIDVDESTLVEEHCETDGIPWPSRRRVWARRPDGSPRTSPQPLMVKLDVHEWRLS
jgi:hypothetical protein